MGFLTSCDSKSETWSDVTGVIGRVDKNFKTLDQFINEFGEPTEIVNSMEDFINKSNNYNDWFNPEHVSNEEISKMYKEYKFLFNFRTNKIQYKKDNFRSNQKNTFYSETNRNRLDREKELGFKFSSMGPEVGYTFISPKLINYYYKYYFDLGNSTYGDYMGYDDGDLPPDTDIQIMGSLDLDSNKEIVSNNQFYRYASISLCDCLTKSELSDAGECKDKFLQTYGTEEPSVDQMRRDYYNCN
jgi:hypothetical protein